MNNHSLAVLGQGGGRLWPEQEAVQRGPPQIPHLVPPSSLRHHFEKALFSPLPRDLPCQCQQLAHDSAVLDVQFLSLFKSICISKPHLTLAHCLPPTHDSPLVSSPCLSEIEYIFLCAHDQNRVRDSKTSDWETWVSWFTQCHQWQVMVGGCHKWLF